MRCGNSRYLQVGERKRAVAPKVEKPNTKAKIEKKEKAA
jgi:hypothetical protein